MVVFNELVGPNESTYMSLINNVVLDKWYHIVLVMRPTGTTGWRSEWEAHVDGVSVAREGQKLLPQDVNRRMAWLGRSTWTDEDNPYFSAKIDAIRVYDYALTAPIANSLYRLASDPNFVPVVQQPSTSTPVVPSTGGATRPGGPTAAPTSGPTGECEYGGVFPDRCECRCYQGYYPNCIPCPGEEPQGPASTPAVSTAGVVAIILSIVFVLVLGMVAAVWYKNKAGRVTYSLDGGFSDGGDTDGWLNPAAARKAKVGGGGLLGGDVEDSASTYDWQAYRSSGGQAREASMGHWSNQ